MFEALVIFIALIGVIMIGVILLQSGQGGGLAGIASGGATRQVLGSRQAPDILEKATWTLGFIFIALCILTNFFIDTGETQESIIQQQAQEGSAPPASQGATPLQQGGDLGGGQQGGSQNNGGN
jgi:preprotein translocase subunit SecG